MPYKKQEVLEFLNEQILFSKKYDTNYILAKAGTYNGYFEAFELALIELKKVGYIVTLERPLQTEIIFKISW